MPRRARCSRRAWRASGGRWPLCTRSVTRDCRARERGHRLRFDSAPLDTGSGSDRPVRRLIGAAGGGRSRHPARRRRIEAETAPPPPRTAVSGRAPSSSMAARFTAGIDLRTTNPACAFVDTAAGRALRVFEVPQLVAPAEMGARPTLPSFLYLAGAHELPAGSLDPPWATGRAWCVGLFAREQGARVPGRLVASSKSWLCHAAVDRTAPILPWGAGDEVPKVSPVEASARTLTHLREAWDASFPAPLAEQDVVLTVPASFDEVARELTLAAARAAGLPEVVMLEEPQAAFYAWLAANQADWRARVAAHPLVLVVDVGGGTTDLSLIAARASRGELGLERVAVGEHLLLGGDNIDLALAREVEARLLPKGGQLETQRFYGLVSQCRAAKERLLADPCPGEVRLSVPGRGGAVVGGALAARLTRVEVEAVVLDRFFPRVAADARARRGTGLAPREWGLPFAEEPEITRHLAEFLARQREAAGQADQIGRAHV